MVYGAGYKKTKMKKLTHNHPRGLIAAIAVLVSCAGAARAAIDLNNGTNAIAFTEQRGERTANLVLSTLDLAIMDPVERDNMLASLETQYGKPKVWASRADRSTSTSVFGFGRDGSKEKYGVRLRARQAMPIFNSLLSQVAPAEKVPSAIGEIASAGLLGVERSEALTWTANQDDYTGNGRVATGFVYSYSNKWINTGFNYKLDFGEGYYTPTWYGFSIKAKVGADVTGRFDYNQNIYLPFFGSPLNTIGGTRDVNSSAGLGVRTKIELILSWGHDWNLGWAGYWGLGAEASVSVGPWINAGVTMISSNSNGEADFLAVNGSFSMYVEVQGTVWIGRTEHASQDDDFWDPESHKLVAGARAQIVFQGTAGLGIGYKCTEYDWYNDKWNNDMRHNAQIANGTANGKLLARAELRWGPVVFQNGYLLWQGSKRNDGIPTKTHTGNNQGLDLLL
jgi:hypothetical protein